MKEDKPKIFKIGTGIVIDHIPPFRAFDVLSILGLDKPDNTVLAVGVNLKSSKYGAKDVIKVENREICKSEINKISMIAPHATVSRIKDYEILEKVVVFVPEEVRAILRCPNFNCITNSEPIATWFHHTSKDGMNCHYCEKTFRLEDMKLIQD